MNHSLVPSDARPCVWMTAGLLAYRLCDRQFDCENCPLDAGMRGAAKVVRPLQNLSAGGEANRLPDREVAMRAQAVSQPHPRFKEGLLLGATLMLVAVSLPIIGFLAIVGRAVLLVGAMAVLLGGVALYAASPRFRRWLERMLDA